MWTELALPLTAAAGSYSNAVYERSTLSLREFEAARITMARINQCAICIGWRTARDVPGRSSDPGEIPESFYDEVGVQRTGTPSTNESGWPPSSPSATPPTTWAWTTQFWDRLHRHFSDDELVDLALCVASWLALGRFNQVFDIDGACRVPAPTPH